ncbi:hypothetical protein ABMA27_013862 [Loxostege sticticalis]|uniref:MADF domain-containing protein n=1 Tax=Loxostege sticticalis TaxID=481309 RepID=A0ABR3IBU5_LOXSC
MDQETSISLIQTYASHEMLWNPRHEDYYNRTKREEIWDQIAESFGVPKQELMAKMRSLSGSYRRERNREKKRKAKNPTHHSKWYAYEAFSFLHNKDPLASEDLPEPDDGTDENDDDSESQPETKTLIRQSPAPKKNPLKRNQCENKNLTHNLAPKPEKQPRSLSGDDPYITFGLHIASELRKYDARTLTNVKHAIHNIIFQADTNFYQGNKTYHINFPKETSNEQIQIKSDIDFDDDDDTNV